MAPSRHESHLGGKAGSKEEEFRILYLRYYGHIKSFFESMGISPELSQDLTQETFLRAYRGMGLLRDEGSFRPWLHRIAANIFKNERRYRDAMKRSAAEISLEALGPPGLELAVGTHLPLVATAQLTEALARERREVLSRAIAGLPAQMRRCLLLLYQGMGYKEISDILKISTDAVGSHLYEARRRLQLALRQHEREGAG